MTCDKYENALLEAASNGELNAKLARHLERCSTCRMTLRSERKLFSRIDSALRAQVNEDPRPRFLVQLRLQLSKELTARPGSDRVWYVAGAALALVLIAMSYPLVNARRSSVQGSLQMPTIKAPQSAGVTQSARAIEDLGGRSPIIPTVRRSKAQSRRSQKSWCPQMNRKPLRNLWLASPGATQQRKRL